MQIGQYSFILQYDMNSLEIIRWTDVDLNFTFLENGVVLDITLAILTFVINTPTIISKTLTAGTPPNTATCILTHTDTDKTPWVYDYYVQLDDWSWNLSITEKWYFIISDK